MEPDDIYFWREHINEQSIKEFSFNCEPASKIIKAPNQVINKLNNVAIVSSKKEGIENHTKINIGQAIVCLLYTSPSPRDAESSRMPSSA